GIGRPAGDGVGRLAGGVRILGQDEGAVRRDLVKGMTGTVIASAAGIIAEGAEKGRHVRWVVARPGSRIRDFPLVTDAVRRGRAPRRTVINFGLRLAKLVRMHVVPLAQIPLLEKIVLLQVREYDDRPGDAPIHVEPSRRDRPVSVMVIVDRHANLLEVVT